MEERERFFFVTDITDKMGETLAVMKHVAFTHRKIQLNMSSQTEIVST
jgi:hypothetical protein